MKNTIRKKMLSIRELISNNVETIKSLMQQEKELGETIEKLSSLTADGIDEIKIDLEKQRDNLVNNLDSYIKNTNNLFEKYDKLVDSIL